MFLDSGSTVFRVVSYLKDIRELTVITNSIAAVNEAMEYRNINLIVLPGILKRNTESTFGMNCVEFLENYNIDIAFMACTGISENFTVCNSFIEEYYLKKAVLEKSVHRFLLADSGKFGRSALVTYGSVGSFDSIITDSMPDEYYRNGCAERGCDIMLSK